MRRDEFHRYFDRVGRVERRLFDPHNPLEFLTAEAVFVRFRFRPQTIFYIVDFLEDSLRRPAGNGSIALTFAVRGFGGSAICCLKLVLLGCRRLFSPLAKVHVF